MTHAKATILSIRYPFSDTRNQNNENVLQCSGGESEKIVQFPVNALEKSSVWQNLQNQIDPETFWTLEDGDFKEMLEVKSWGKRKRLLQRIEEIKKEHEKIME